MLPPSCLKDTLHSLVKKCSMVTRDRKEPPSENSRDLFFFFQSLSCVCLFATLWTATHQASLSFTISWSLLKFMSIESVMPSNYLVLCCPLLLLPSIFPSIRVFSSEPAVHIRWPKAQNVVFAECLYRASQKSLLWGREPGWLLLLFSHCHVWLCDPRACQAPLSSTISWSWRKFVSIESMILSNHLILCFPVFLFPSIFPNFRVFSSESVLCISIGASATVLPMSIRGLFPFELTVVISLQSKRLWRVFSSTTIQKCQFFSTLPSL